MSIFFFATSVAIFISLLAWGDVMKKPREYISELERQFIKKMRSKKVDVLPIIRPLNQFSFKQQMSSLIKLWETDFGKTELELRNIIKDLQSKKESIEYCYRLRYYGVLSLFLLSSILGLLSYNFGESQFVRPFKLIQMCIHIKYDVVFICILFAAILVIITNMILTNVKEKRFTDLLYHTFDQLED